MSPSKKGALTAEDRQGLQLHVEEDMLSVVSTDSGSLASSRGSTASNSYGSVLSVCAGSASSSERVPAGYFRCSKCRKCLSISMMCSSRSNVCKMDSASYKSLVTQWQKNRQLKTWFQGKTPEEQVQWYLKQQARHGEKRKLDTLEYSEQNVEDIKEQEKELDDFKTWSRFKRDGLLEQKSVPQLEQEWKELIESPHTECIFRRGQWLVPEFVGVQRAAVNEHGHRFVSAQGANITTAEQLEQLQRSGQMLQEQFLNSIQPAVMQTPLQPVVHSTPAEQPFCTGPQDILSQQIAREVPWSLFAIQSVFIFWDRDRHYNRDLCRGSFRDLYGVNVGVYVPTDCQATTSLRAAALEREAQAEDLLAANAAAAARGETEAEAECNNAQGSQLPLARVRINGYVNLQKEKLKTYLDSATKNVKELQDSVASECPEGLGESLNMALAQLVTKKEDVDKEVAALITFMDSQMAAINSMTTCNEVKQAKNTTDKKMKDFGSGTQKEFNKARAAFQKTLKGVSRRQKVAAVDKKDQVAIPSAKAVLFGVVEALFRQEGSINHSVSFFEAKGGLRGAVVAPQDTDNVLGTLAALAKIAAGL